MFVGAKMLIEDWVHIPAGVSLAVIVATLGAAVGASLAVSARRERTAV